MTADAGLERQGLDLSIIIVNHETWDELDGCLASLQYLIEAEWPSTEIIVVDNSRGDGRTVELSRRYSGVSVVENSGNHGFAHACNLGARHAIGDELLFLNPDVRDPGGAVRRFVTSKREWPEVTILTVRQIDRLGRPQRTFGRFPTALTLLGPVRILLRGLRSSSFPDPRRTRALNLQVDWVSGSALMISAIELESLGGWCDDYWMYSEDVDLCRRAADEGRLTGYIGDVVLEHRHGGASRQNREVSALTRAEVIISKHLYAHRHLGRFHAGFYHLLLFLTRLPPLIMSALLARVWRGAPDAVHVRAGMFRHLVAHYRRIVVDRNWRSPRSIRFHGTDTCPPASHVRQQNRDSDRTVLPPRADAAPSLQHQPGDGR